MSIVVTAFVIQLSIAIVAFALREEVSNVALVRLLMLYLRILHVQAVFMSFMLMIFSYCLTVVTVCKR